MRSPKLRLKTEPIPLERAATLMCDFLKEKSLKDFSDNYGLGGIVPVAHIYPAPDDPIGQEYYGTLAWFCFNQLKGNSQRESGDLPDFFLAFEFIKKGEINPLRNPIQVPDKPLRDELNTPIEVFPCPEGPHTQESIEEYLKTHKSSNSGTGGKKVLKDDVTRHASRFKDHNLKDPNGETYSIHPLGFFEDGEKQYIKNFVAQSENGVKYVRYYLGFDKEDKPNRIRIILVPVDADGNTILIDSGGKAADMLQKSWPPPPNTLARLQSE